MSPLPLLAVNAGPDLPPGVELSDDGDHLTLRATRDLTGVGSGLFAQPAVAVHLQPADRDIELVGWSFGQFAWPVRSRRLAPFELNPTANVHSPPAIIPLLARAGTGEVELLAPLDGWYEQLIAVEQAERITALRWGWHGDLDEVPAGFTTTLGRFRGATASEVLTRWGRQVLAAAGTRRPAADADPCLTHLSYWTDNGAAYWYRTGPGLDMTTTLTTKVAELTDLAVPVRSVELDSWFYPHEVNRPVTDGDGPADVPPTGMLEWAPRADVLPDGVGGLASALGARPLILHARHISPASPYLATGEWWTELAAVPTDPAFFDLWFADAARWGATCVELDWLLLFWFGARGLRSQPGRGQALLAGIDDAARRHGLHLLLCMALPGDLLASVGLGRVVAVRTSDDYRSSADPAHLWVWYLTVNLLASALELRTFKDCFLSSLDPGPDGGDGDRWAEVEALLAVLSAGVVGIGDRIGRTDPALLSRVCRPDGRLLGPDRPVTIDDSRVFSAGRDQGELCWASTSSGPWRYVVALHVAGTTDTIADHLSLGGEVLVYDWRRQAAVVADHVEVELAYRDWALFVCCPIWNGSEGPTALVGDPTVYATMSADRIDLSDGSASLRLSPEERNGVLRRWTPDLGLFDTVVSRSTKVHLPDTGRIP